MICFDKGTGELLTKAVVLGYDVNRSLSYANQSYSPYEKETRDKTHEYLMQAKERLATLERIINEALSTIKEES